MNRERLVAAVGGLEDAAMQLMEDLRYVPTVPNREGESSVLLLQYVPVPWDQVVVFLAQRGWRRHDELAIIKPRKIIGGVFDDLVTYVPVDEPDNPIIVEKQDVPPNYEPDLWSVKPVVTETFEERPADD